MTNPEINWPVEATVDDITRITKLKALGIEYYASIEAIVDDDARELLATCRLQEYSVLKHVAITGWYPWPIRKLVELRTNSVAPKVNNTEQQTGGITEIVAVSLSSILGETINNGTKASVMADLAQADIEHEMMLKLAQTNPLLFLDFCTGIQKRAFNEFRGIPGNNKQTELNIIAIEAGRKRALALILATQ